MRARGANARQRVKFESSYGVVPSTAGWKELPFVSSRLGAEQGLIESDLLGQGRESYDPTLDVVNNAGDHVVPVDVRAIGYWLKLFLGNPTTTEATGVFTHVYQSGADTLPSMSIELAKPEVPEFGVNYGVRGNTFRIGLSRRGLLNATLGLIAKGEEIESSTQAGSSPGSVQVERFAQATGEIKKDGTTLGNVVSAEFGFSNNLDPVETIRPDSEIEDADPAMFTATGSLGVRFADRVLLDAATGRDPIALSFGWAFEGRSLLFALPRVFLPRPKREITGPGGIEISFNWQASGGAGRALTATLVNDVATY